jgi:hypothetical protein
MPYVDREVFGTNGRSYFQQHFDHEYLTDELVNYFQDLLEEVIDR